MNRIEVLAAIGSLLVWGAVTRAAEPDAPPPSFADVAPVLQAHCTKCHSGEKPKAQLDLTSPTALSKGGESGPAVVPGHPDKSPLLEMIADGTMPPEDEPKLATDQVELIRRWIVAGAGGANLPDTADPASSVDPAPGEFWAFKRLKSPGVPPVSDVEQLRTTVDNFIVARLEQANLRLSPEADRHSLLRRLSFDLVGLPPTPDEIDAFTSDQRADSYERLVDRLLASPHFGQRWGRHWLDGAGYSDITGGDNDAGIVKLSENKWKYRDYVVRAYNDDKPYDRFLIEQLAGDELVDWRSAPTFTPQIKELLTATGFLRNAADDTDEKELTTPDILHGVLQRTGEVVAVNLLGLTVGCAKCHDHKYEPISQRDYYRFLAAFTPTFNPASWVPPKSRALADISPTEKAAAEKYNAELDQKIGQFRGQQAEIKRPTREGILAAKLAALPEQIRADVKQSLETPADKRNTVQEYLGDKFKAALNVSEVEIAAALTQPQKERLAEIDRQIAGQEQTRRHWGVIQAAYDVGPPPPTHLLKRGNFATPGVEVQPGFFAVLCSGESAAGKNVANATVRSGQPAGATSGRRLALARWLTDWSSPAGALAARVRVNRIWQHLFGHGIVETTENLGRSGAGPSHPELLDWLACRFVADGCRTKPLIKLLVMSAVYRQASTGARDAAPADASSTGSPGTVDPANRLLARMPLRRLEAEIVRDAILATSGQLDPSLGGPALPLEVRPDGMVVMQSPDPAHPEATCRRSLYVLARRHYHLSLLGVFDQPTMSMNCPNRQQSAVVSQSLTMLNDQVILDAADKFAARVMASAGAGEAAAQIGLAFKMALSRPPNGEEMAWSQELLSQQAAAAAAESQPSDVVAKKSLAHLCHMLLSSNEFLYVP
jgi:Protein of unknown function (DUF1553)/Protein of unknown function (DUF1549)/Planctomycete cytochrome C